MNIITDSNYLIRDNEFDSCQFEKINIANSSLMAKYFFSSTFVDCDFSNCDINGTVFRDCKFINCNLSLVRFSNVDLHAIIFNNCKLIGVNWTLINWKNRSSKKKIKFPITFTNSILDYSIFIGLDMYAVLFSNSMLKEVSFEEANLEYANFENTDLSGSLFRNTMLKNADFSTAKNYTINACVNSVKGAKFSLPEVLNLIYALEVEIV